MEDNLNIKVIESDHEMNLILELRDKDFIRFFNCPQWVNMIMFLINENPKGKPQQKNRNNKKNWMDIPKQKITDSKIF